jgi:hypothetical protein
VNHDHYPLTEDLVLTLAALQICNEPKAELRKCVPKNWYKKHELAEWDKMINSKSNFLGLRGFNPAMARHVYLQYHTFLYFHELNLNMSYVHDASATLWVHVFLSKRNRASSRFCCNCDKYFWLALLRAIYQS